MLTKIYYALKPILPWRLRLALRQVRAQRRRKAFAKVWPIDASACAVPPGWPGWPDGKQFALVLTHDVEGQKGFDRIPRLIDLTRKYGFRASFNLVPKGEYQVDNQLLDLLNCSGFEPGVHGLEHDGKLYQSREKFAAKAIEIRKVLGNWGACGFRSPLMQHRLGWIHTLQSEYDASTFDVDPFEPQPDGMSTIFPFWVQGEGNTGYVELPYSLVQDFSLFKVLGEKNIDIWKKKLDWVAQHGGMALINTHPDYMCFEGNPARDEYPVAYYEEFLKYAREKYNSNFWHALPRDVARYYCQKLPVGSRNTRRKICVIAQTEYESDSRIRLFAENLTGRGDMVDVISVRPASAGAAITRLNGVTVHHVLARTDTEPGPLTGLLHQLLFLARASFAVGKLHDHNRYDVIHIQNVPDLMVFVAWRPKLSGAKLILEFRDAAPERFDTQSSSSLNKLSAGILKIFEKLSAKFADHVIISNPELREKLIARSVDDGHCSVVVSSSDAVRFTLSNEEDASATGKSEVTPANDVRESLVAHPLENDTIDGSERKSEDYQGLIDVLSTERFRNGETEPDQTQTLER